MMLHQAIVVLFIIAQGWLQTFPVGKPDLATEGESAYFILKPGYQTAFEGKSDGKAGKLVITVLNETLAVGGIDTRIVEEREWSGGELVEVSRNYFAINPKTGDVYYFGEDVDMYKKGKVVNHEGSWRHGTNGARFGLMMPGKPVVGMKFYQEQAKGVAMDRSEIVSVTEKMTTRAGAFDRCVKSKETTPLEPLAREYKFYAPGVGLVQDGDLELVSHQLVASSLLVSAQQPGPSVAPPAPIGAVPSARQLAWHEREFYGFIHFTVNTFTDKEWGYGDEAESVFNPTALDARQWARVARDAGMKGLIITAKHHDGFALWPSRFTEHSVKRSPWKDGKGDVVGDLAAACREFGLAFGVYLSPWDRNHAEYGRPAYLEYYRNQLRELLTNYGTVAEVWFDGANGGDGYYGGARERRRIDGSTYYDWANTWKLVRELQPMATMFSDVGPDVRWVGNEKGVAFETSWNPITLEGYYPGHPRYTQIAAGKPDGADWVPPEVDVSIRPGWFYHPAEDSKVASVDKLVEIYEQSIGRGSNLLLNIPPDRRGLIPDIDAERLREFGERIASTYKTDLARQATARAGQARGNAAAFAAARVNDGDPGTYWATDDGVSSGTLDLQWAVSVRIDRLVIQEAIALGQRVEAWTAEAETDAGWTPIARGTTIGHKRIATFPPVTTKRVRLTIEKARASLAISAVGAYLAPGPKPRQ